MKSIIKKNIGVVNAIVFLVFLVIIAVYGNKLEKKTSTESYNKGYEDGFSSGYNNGTRDGYNNAKKKEIKNIEDFLSNVDSVSFNNDTGFYEIVIGGELYLFE